MIECNTCEYCLASPLYKGVCTKVEPNHIFTEEDRQKWFAKGHTPDWCPIRVAQSKVNTYVKQAIKFPLDDGQLVSMVILHFALPDRQAMAMVIISLLKLVP